MSQLNLLLFIPALLMLRCSNESQTTDTGRNMEPTMDSSCIDWAELRIDEFIISNNVWGKGTETNYEQCVYYESINNKTEFGWNWNWPGNGNVRGFPEIIFGLKPWSTESTSSLLPARINNNNITINYSCTASAIGQWNLAFDIWLTSSITPTPENVTHEIMIWMHKTNSISPAGNNIGTIAIDDNQYELWLNENHNNSWMYIAFVSENTNLDASLNLNVFWDYLISNDYVSEDLFISGIEFGTEIFEGTGSIRIDDYNVAVQ